MVPDCDLPLNLWTKNQLISGIEESIRDMQGLEDQKEALIRELERMKKTLQKNGLSSSIEMNQEMKNLLGEVLKCVSCHNIKMVWKDNPELIGKFYQQIYDDFLIRERVAVRHEKHPLPLENMIRIYGEDLWDYFKTLRQTTQTDLANAAFGKCTGAVCVLRLIHPSIRALFVLCVPQNAALVSRLHFTKANLH